MNVRIICVNIYLDASVCVCVYMCVYVCVYVCVCVCVCVCDKILVGHITILLCILLMHRCDLIKYLLPNMHVCDKGKVC